MSQNFTDIAFSQEVKEAQEKYGSRQIYEKVAANLPDQSRITLREQKLIEKMDGFYMATTNNDGWPYVQFRGGPRGFLRVLDKQTLGFADFKGNLQYISTGNINATHKAALILLHYPTRTRLKIWAETEILDPRENTKLAKQLVIDSYGATVERLVIFHIKAFDWNCPQHIPQRFTLEEIKDILPNHPEIIEDSCL